MALPGLVAAKNLADVADRERAWDNLGLNVSANVTTPESLAYIAAVEQADGAFLEEQVKQAIHAFVAGCKIDGIWSAIKACCILAGARTLNGALVPLAGTAPTNIGNAFVAGDYNRKLGLKGDGNTKRLNTNRANDSDPLNDNHNAVYITERDSVALTNFIMGNTNAISSANAMRLNGSFRIRDDGNVGQPRTYTVPTLFGISRASGVSRSRILNGSIESEARASQSASAGNIIIFNRIDGSTDSSNARLAFYSIGESLDLALLDARVTTLINAFAAAIP